MFWPLPDEAHSFLHSLAAFGCFLLFLAATLGFGTLISRCIPRSESNIRSGIFSPFDLAFGSGMLSLLIELQSQLHNLGPRYAFLNWLGISVGIGAFFLRIKNASVWAPGKSTNHFSFRSWGTWILISCGYLVLLRVLEGFRLHSHGDALYYHLAGPADFFYHGGVYFNSGFPQTLQSTSWENLNLWGLQLIAGENGRGLTLVQCFGQWTHSVIGYGGTAWLLFHLLKKWSVDPRIIGLGILCGLSVEGLSWSSHLAKNDWGTAFWIIAGITLWTDHAKSRSAHFLAAALVGLGLIGKPVYGLAMVGILLAHHKKLFSSSVSDFVLLMLGFSLGFGPIALRNWFLSGNPVFPWGQSFFHSDVLSPTLEKALQTASQMPILDGFFWKSFLHRLSEWIRSSPLSILLIPLTWTLLRRPTFPSLLSATQRDGLLAWSMGLGFSLILLALFLPPFIEFRYMGPALIVASALAPILLAPILNRPTGLWILLPVWIGCIAFSKPPHHVFAQLLPSHFKPLETQLRSQTNGELKAWIRQNLPFKEPLTLIADNEIYYLLPHPLQVTHLGKDMDIALEKASNAAEILSALSQPATQLVMDQKSIPEPNPKITQALEAWVQSDPNRILFKTNSGRMIRLTE